MKKTLFLTLVIIFISYIIVTLFNNNDNYELIYNSSPKIRVMRSDKKIVEEIPIEQYIVGVLAGEMPISFDIEALKAQAVASRSYAKKRMIYNKNKDYDVIDTTTNQVYLDNEELKEAWGKNYEKNYKKIIEAVSATLGEYVTYDGEVIDAFFFSTSTGITENSENVFSESLPYLKSVSSTWDSISPVYRVTKTFKLKEFYEKLKIKYSNNLEIKYLSKTKTDKVKKISINNVEFAGGDIVDIFKLKSSYFTLKQEGDKIIITTKGYGHGVGMSQYGAYAMALQGYNYKEILKYYYQGVEIEKI